MILEVTTKGPTVRPPFLFASSQTLQRHHRDLKISLIHYLRCKGEEGTRNSGAVVSAVAVFVVSSTGAMFQKEKGEL